MVLPQHPAPMHPISCRTHKSQQLLCPVVCFTEELLVSVPELGASEVFLSTVPSQLAIRSWDSLAWA